MVVSDGIWRGGTTQRLFLLSKIFKAPKDAMNYQTRPRS